MSVALWVLTGVLAVVFVISGTVKIILSPQRLAARGMAFVESFPPAAVKVIGVLEVLAAVGLVAPAASGVALVLVPAAAAGLAAMMVGAIVTHLVRHEIAHLLPALVLLVLAVVVTWGRLGPAPLTS